jgi:hypothetical protein
MPFPSTFIKLKFLIHSRSLFRKTRVEFGPCTSTVHARTVACGRSAFYKYKTSSWMMGDDVAQQGAGAGCQVSGMNESFFLEIQTGPFILTFPQEVALNLNEQNRSSDQNAPKPYEVLLLVSQKSVVPQPAPPDDNVRPCDDNFITQNKFYYYY